ncbi:MAG: D-Lysine 56-aminomutase, alpha subunit, partial [Blastococcus sp.]|nr:D-Lysine 56-aminomutase, alpha subunit [Blastococcus sp.]
MTTLNLDRTLMVRARELAARAARPVVDLAQRHTTVSVERAVLRLAGLTGTDPVTGEGQEQDKVPWVNRVVDAVRDQVGLESGVALPVWHAIASGAAPDLNALAEQVGAGTACFTLPEGAAA